MNLEQLQALKTFLPTSEELVMVRAYEGDKMKLDRPEQFFFELESIPHVQARVESWIFERTFEERLYNLVPQINGLRKAFREVADNQKFLLFLQIILAIGNYLNGGTSNGRAYGFKIDFLSKVGDTKASDGKHTLLHYLVKVVETNYPNSIGWMNELKNIEPASKVGAPNLREDVQALRIGVKQIFDEIDLLSSNDQDVASKAYLTRMNRFVSQAKKKLVVLDCDMEEMMKAFKNMAIQFAEDPETLKWEEFFALILSFDEALQKAKLDQEREGHGDIRNSKKKNKPGMVGTLRSQGTSDATGGASDVLQGQRNTESIQTRREVRRAKSIRRVQGGQEEKQNLNNLLDMIDKMKKLDV